MILLGKSLAATSTYATISGAAAAAAAAAALDTATASTAAATYADDAAGFRTSMLKIFFVSFMSLLGPTCPATFFDALLCCFLSYSEPRDIYEVKSVDLTPRELCFCCAAPSRTDEYGKLNVAVCEGKHRSSSASPFFNLPSWFSRLVIFWIYLCTWR